MRLAVLGPLAVDGEVSVTARRDRIVLEALAVEASRPVSTERLADALWPGGPPDSAVKVVQGCVSRLRRTLGASTIETTADGYRLKVQGIEIDAVRFDELVGRCRELLEVGAPERAVHAAGQALALWRGRPFHDLDDWEAARVERRRLDELRCEAEELAVEASLRAGDHRAVLATAHGLTEREPLRERRWVQLARAQYQAGSQTEALRTLRLARSMLREQAGLDPGDELAAVEAAILRHDPTLDVASAGAEAGSCPYPGLVPFGLADSELFFGREELVAACLESLDRDRVVAVVGPSGSGKSSVVRAGIAAAWRRNGRSVRVVTPSGLTASDGDPNGIELLVVDQLEEVIGIDGGDRVVDLVAGTAQHAAVVLAIRADRLGDLSADAGVARLVERGLVLLPAMTEDELRRAIEEPARAAGLLLEPGLVDLLVREVEGEPGALPLLSHALRSTWERREGRVLTVAGYRDSGALRGAVAQTAEHLYRGLDAERRGILRDLMLRMLTPSPEGDAVRSPVPRRLVAGDVRRERLVEQLVDARLVTSDGDTVELAHEALVRGWPRLRTWLDDDVDGQRILRHLTLAADGWASMGRPDSELYRGTRLAGALSWRDRTAPTLTPVESEFLEASGRVARAEQDALERRARNHARQNRRLRAALGAVAVLLALATVAGVTAVRSADQARQAASAAEHAAAASLIGLSQRLAEHDRGLALLLAVEAHRAAPSNATRAAMLSALVDAPFRRTSVLTPADGHNAVAIDAAGTVAAAKRADGSLDVIDLVTRRVRHAALPGAPGFVGGVGVDADGRFAASGGSGEQPTVVYDLDTGEAVASLPTAGFAAVTTFSPDGGLLAIGQETGSIEVYDAGSWTLARTIDVGAPVSAVAFADDGLTVYAGTVPSALPGADPAAPAMLVAFDVGSGAAVAGPVDTGEVVVTSIDVRPGGDELAYAGLQFHRRALDGLDPVGEPFGRAEVDLVTIAFSADGTLVAGSPVELHVFDVDAPEGPVETWTSALGSPGVALTADAARLVTADSDGKVSTWTLEPPEIDLGEAVIPGLAGQVLLAEDQGALVVWERGPVSVVDLATRRIRFELPLDAGDRVLGVDVDRSARRLVTLSCPLDTDPCTADLEVWDLETGDRVAGPSTVGEVWAGLRHGVAFARDDRWIAVPLASGEVGAWDATSLEPSGERLRLADHTALVGWYAWGIDAVDVGGRSLVIAQDELGQSVSWDVTQEPATLIGALENAFRMQYLPDGQLVTANGPGALVVRDPFTIVPRTDAMPGTTPADTYSISEDGMLVASGDHGVLLFDLESETPLTPQALPGVRSAIASDGSRLYLGAAPGSGAVREISMDDAHLVADACRAAGRNLASDEWRRLIGSSTAYRPTCDEWPSATALEPTTG